MDLKHKWKSHSIVSTAIIDSVAVQYTHTAPTQCRYIRIPIDRMSSWAHISTFGYHQHQRKHTWYKESTNRKHTSSTNGVRKWDIDFIRCFFYNIDAWKMDPQWKQKCYENTHKIHINAINFTELTQSQHQFFWQSNQRKSPKRPYTLKKTQRFDRMLLQN